MYEVQKLAQYVAKASFDSIDRESLLQLKIRVLDTLGVAMAALDAEPIVAIRKLIAGFGENGDAALIGGGRASLDRAAFYNVALSRYLDFMDSYLAPGETCHPSDNIGAVLAAADSVGASGKDFLTAVAVAYQVQTRLSDVAPVRAKGFDHTVQGAYASAAGVARALGLSAEQTANAIAISGTANNALRVTRTGDLSNWKGLAYPNTAKEGAFAALLARAGITGPGQVFEGNKGFKDSIAGPFEIDWAQEGLDSVLRTIVKKHNAEIHSQSTLDAALMIRAKPGFDLARVGAVKVTTFQVAYDIIGGGEEGDKHHIHTKEEADHSLPYMVAAALLDGRVEPEQYRPERINAPDIQTLLKKVVVQPDADFTARFPAEMPSRIEFMFDDRTSISAETASYHGFVTNPLDWDSALEKYLRMATPFAGADLAQQVAALVHDLDRHAVTELTALLGKVSTTRAA